MADAPSAPTRIWQALRDRARRAASPCPVVEPGSTEDLPVDRLGMPAEFVALGDIPAAPRRISIGPGAWMHSGVLVLTLASPVGEPYSYYKERASQIAGFFAEDIILRGRDCIHITSRSTPGTGYQDGAYWRIPIRVSWQCAV